MLNTYEDMIAQARQNAAFILNIADQEDWSRTDLMRIIAEQTTTLAFALEETSLALASAETFAKRTENVLVAALKIDEELGRPEPEYMARIFGKHGQETDVLSKFWDAVDLARG